MLCFEISLYVYVEGMPASAAALEAGCVPFNSCQSKSINGRGGGEEEEKGSEGKSKPWREGRKDL